MNTQELKDEPAGEPSSHEVRRSLTQDAHESAPQEHSRSLRIGRTYRYARPYTASPSVVDGLPNYFSVVASPGRKLALLESGINPIRGVNGADGTDRCPAILLSSSPHKAGSSMTPWEDVYDIDNGAVRYFGDNKDEKDPSKAPGNIALLRQLALHTAQDAVQRARAAPILFFRRVTVDRRIKGNVMFLGVGVLQRAERVTEFDRSREIYFTNYAFEFVVFDLSNEAESVMWDWIEGRGDPNLTSEQTLSRAPAAWRDWVAHGKPSIERCRRRVSKLMTVHRADQVPRNGSPERKALDLIYAHYGRPTFRRLFEHLASSVVERLIVDSGAQYRHGWVTQNSGDGGADFVGRVDVGTGFARTRLVLLGQAKCEKPDAPTGGNHIARTVARLKRGWIGAYVTTSYFSEPVQLEVIEDEYPIMLVNGLQVARAVLAMARDAGCVDVLKFLKDFDAAVSAAIHLKRPEEILRE